jgi:hypothetical protein
LFDFHLSRRPGSNLQYTFNKIQKIYIAGRELPIVAITITKFTYPELLHICQRKPDDGLRIIPLDGQEQKHGGFEKMQSVIYNIKTKGNAKKR